jgi:hypothetical protein
MIIKYIYKLVLITFLMLTTFATISAQSAPGLLGKRLIVSYDYGFYINLKLDDTYTTNGVEDETSVLQIISDLTIPKHYFGAEYILSKRLSVGLNYNFYRRNLNAVSIGSSNTLNFIHNVSASEYSVHLKYFSSKAIAPIGHYNQIRVFAFNYTSRLNGREEFFEEEPPVYVFDKDLKLGLAYGFGRQGIIFSNILYNIGCEIGLVSVPLSPGDNGLANDLRNSILLDNVFKIKVGIAVPIY